MMASLGLLEKLYKLPLLQADRLLKPE
uniref:Uncharacterized protein n=1 Tax=Anguilla anguilla TaxID=7936 RepID=A0A0E9R3Q8_ANGAN